MQAHRSRTDGLRPLLLRRHRFWADRFRGNEEVNIGGVYVRAIGASLGAKRVDNEAVAASCGKDANFVAERIGATEVRRAAPGETAVSLATAACREAMGTAGIAAKDVALLV